MTRKEKFKKLRAELAEAQEKAKKYKIVAEAGKLLACTLLQFRTDEKYPDLLHIGAAEFEALLYFTDLYEKNINPAKIFCMFGRFQWLDEPGPRNKARNILEQEK